VAEDQIVVIACWRATDRLVRRIDEHLRAHLGTPVVPGRHDDDDDDAKLQRRVWRRDALFVAQRLLIIASHTSHRCVDDNEFIT